MKLLQPKILLQIIDPVQSPEVALIARDGERRDTATSFHYADAASASNLVLSARATAVLKTETTVGCEEFDEYHLADGDEEEDAPEGVGDKVALVFGAIHSFCECHGLIPPALSAEMLMRLCTEGDVGERQDADAFCAADVCVCVLTAC